MSARPYRGRSSQSYSRRLQRRAVRPTRWRWPASTRRWQGAAWLSAGLAVTAELGHLVAAFVEWPESAGRGGYHIVTGALLGLVAAVVCCGPGPARFGVGAAVPISGPALWLGGSLLGASPYAELPGLAAGGIAASEVALAALLFGAWRALRPAKAVRG